MGSGLEILYYFNYCLSMARPLRLEFPGAIYHVTSRGNARQKIYVDDNDRLLFLSNLDSVVERYNWICHAYCLMNNHYHLLIETPDSNLSIGMRQLNGIYTQGFNRRHKEVGHLLQGRFKAILVDKDNYLLELCRYIVLNPIRAGFVNKLSEYKWSSYKSTAGTTKSPNFLTTGWILSHFDRDEDNAKRKYRKFVREGRVKEGPWDQLMGQIILGDDKYLEKIESLLKKSRYIKEIPREQRYMNRPRLDKIFNGKEVKTKKERNRRIRYAHIKYGYKLSEIGRVLGLHYATVSRIVNK